MNLTHTQVLALSKLFTKEQLDEARKNVPPGEHEANLFLSASVSFKKGEDGTRLATARIPYKAVISLLLDKLNASTGESVLSLLEDALEKAFELGDANAAAQVIEGELTLDKGLKMLREAVAKAEPIKTSGRITATRKDVRASSLDDLSIQEVQKFNDLLEGGGK